MNRRSLFKLAALLPFWPRQGDAEVSPKVRQGDTAPANPTITTTDSYQFSRSHWVATYNLPNPEKSSTAHF